MSLWTRVQKWVKRKLKREKIKKLEVQPTIEREKLSEASIRKIRALAAGVANKALKIGENTYPEDVLLLWLDENEAFTPESATIVPEEYLAAMYSLWTEGFVMHRYDDRVFVTPSGRYVIKILKMKLSGDKKWKKYT